MSLTTSKRKDDAKGTVLTNTHNQIRCLVYRILKAFTSLELWLR